MISNLTTTDLTAIIGALTGSAALIWQIINGVIDRRIRLAVTVREGMGWSNEDGNYASVFATIFNLGKIAVPITAVYLMSENLAEYDPVWEGPILIDGLQSAAMDFPCSIEPGGVLETSVKIDRKRATRYFDANGNPSIKVFYSTCKIPICQEYTSSAFARRSD